jgi:hypothetical protein
LNNMSSRKTKIMGVSLGGVTVLQQFPKTVHFEIFTAAPILLQ